MRLTELHACIPLCESKDYGSAGIDFAAPKLAFVNGFSALITFGALTGNSVLTAYAGATAAKTTAIPFSYRLSAADFKAALSDQYGDPIAVASTGLTLTAATFDHRMVAIEIDPETMPDGKSWLTLSISAVATVLNVAAVGIGRARNPGHLMASVL